MPRQFVKAYRYFAVAAAASWPCTAAIAQPQAPPHDAGLEKVGLQYRAPAQCPDEASFVELVRKRLATDWQPSARDLARPIKVVVAKVHEEYVATAEFETLEGRRLARAVRGRDCREVVNGIALITALAMQSRIDQVPDKGQPMDRAAQGRTADEPVVAPPPAQHTVPGSSAEPIAPTPAASATSIVPGAPWEYGGRPTSARLSARGALAMGVGPKTTPGLAVGTTIEHGISRVGLALQGFWSGRIAASGYPARFGLLAGRVEGCPIAVNHDGAIVLEPCLFIEAGVLSGQGIRGATLDISDGGSSPWIAPGIVGRLVGGVGQLVLELEVAGRFPLRREEFYVEHSAGNPAQIVHEVPAFVLSSALGAGVRF